MQAGSRRLAGWRLVPEQVGRPEAVGGLFRNKAGRRPVRCTTSRHKANFASHTGGNGGDTVVLVVVVVAVLVVVVAVILVLMW